MRSILEVGSEQLHKMNFEFATFSAILFFAATQGTLPDSVKKAAGLLRQPLSYLILPVFTTLLRENPAVSGSADAQKSVPVCPLQAAFRLP